MESKNELKSICFKNCACYDIIRDFDINFDRPKII